MMRGEEEPYDDQAAQLLASAQRLRDSAAPLPERLQAIKEIHRTAGTSIGWGGGLRSVLRHDMAVGCTAGSGCRAPEAVRTNAVEQLVSLWQAGSP